MTSPRPPRGLNYPVQSSAVDAVHKILWKNDALEWNEQWRYRDPDGVVHRSLVATLFPGTERWLTCHDYPHTSIGCVTVPLETQLTCIACIVRSPLHVDPNPLHVDPNPRKS